MKETKEKRNYFNISEAPVALEYVGLDTNKLDAECERLDDLLYDLELDLEKSRKATRSIIAEAQYQVVLEKNITEVNNALIQLTNICIALQYGDVEKATSIVNELKERNLKQLVSYYFEQKRDDQEWDTLQEIAGEIKELAADYNGADKWINNFKNWEIIKSFRKWKKYSII